MNTPMTWTVTGIRLDSSKTYILIAYIDSYIYNSNKRLLLIVDHSSNGICDFKQWRGI